MYSSNACNHQYFLRPDFAHFYSIASIQSRYSCQSRLRQELQFPWVPLIVAIWYRETRCTQELEPTIENLQVGSSRKDMVKWRSIVHRKKAIWLLFLWHGFRTVRVSPWEMQDLKELLKSWMSVVRRLINSPVLCSSKKAISWKVRTHINFFSCIGELRAKEKWNGIREKPESAKKQRVFGAYPPPRSHRQTKGMLCNKR